MAFGLLLAGAPVSVIAQNATNRVSVAAPSGVSDPTPGNNTATDSDTIVFASDLTIAKTQRTGTSGAFSSSQLTVVAGSVVQFQIVVGNAGPSTVANATFSDPVPSNFTGLTVVSATPASGATACTASFSGNALTGSFSSPKDGTCTVIVQGTATTATTAAGVNNTATATPPTGTTDPTPATSTVNTVVTAPSLTVTKVSSAGSTFVVGSTATYMVTITNNGTASATGVSWTDNSTGLTGVALAPDTASTGSNPGTCTGLTCSGITVAANGGTVTYTVTGTVNGASGTNATNTASVSGGGCPATGVCSATDTDPIIAPATTSVVKSSNPATGDTVTPGQVISYTLTTTVSGSALTQALTLADTLSANQTFGSVTNAGAYTCTGSLSCVLPAGTLPGTYAVTYTATVNANATGTVGNNVAATNPAGGDPDPVCTTCTTTHPVTPATTSVVKSSNPATGDTVTPGQVISYTLTATVSGSALTQALTLADTLSANQTFGSVTNAGAYTCTGSLSCVLPAGTLPGTYAVTYTATVNANATGTVGNNVAATNPAGGDPDPVCTTCTTTHPVALPEITSRKSSNPATGSTVTPGQVISYTLTTTVANTALTTGYTLTDTLSGPQAFGSVTNAGAYTCNAAIPLVCTLPAGTLPGTYTVTYTTTVNTDATGSVGNNVVGAGGGDPDPACSTCTTTHTVQPVMIRLTKQASPRNVRVGDLVRYTLIAENMGEAPLVDGTLVDTPPAGFSYVDGSLAVADDDASGRLLGTYPIRVDRIDIDVGKRATITYLLRVGAGVRAGEHVNTAQVTYLDLPVSNAATATVQLVSDPMIDETTILGSVFDDRDGDGWQDAATAGGVHVQGGFSPESYVPNSTTVDRGDGPQPEADHSAPLLHGIALGTLAGRQSDADPASAHSVSIRQTLRTLAFNDDFTLTSDQGFTVRMDAAGNTRVETSGDAAKGLDGVDLKVERHISQVADGYEVEYVVSNEGVDERGIPGVRIASVEGLLIETDQYGRYHLVGIPGGGERGRNFILKVDSSTLPPGSVFTTRNPLLRRITGGVPVRFDFGVKLPPGLVEGGVAPLEMNLGEVLFAPDSAEVQPKYRPVIEQMADKVKAHGDGEVVISANAHAGSGEAPALAYDRAKAVRDALLELLAPEQAQGLKVSLRTEADAASTTLLTLGQSPAGEPSVVLGTVLFDTDRADIRPEFAPLIDKLAADIGRLGGGVVGVIGHADRRGSDAYNVQLGIRRAKAVFDAIAAKLDPEARSKLRVDISDDPTAPVGNRQD